MDLEPLLSATPVIKLHVATVVPAAFIGFVQFLMPKGTLGHKIAGYTFMGLMILTAITAFFIPSFMGSRFSFIHLFIPLTMVGVIRAWIAIRAGDVKRHIFAMTGVYFGALLIAGYFSFGKGRIMNDMFFGG